MQALFDNWIVMFNSHEKQIIMAGVSVVFWTIHKLRKIVVFDNPTINDPCVPVNMIARLLNDWTILQKKQGNQELLKWGVGMFELIASEVFRAIHGWRVGLNRIKQRWKCEVSFVDDLVF